MLEAQTRNPGCKTRCRNREQSTISSRFQEKIAAYSKTVGRNEEYVIERKINENCNIDVPAKIEEISCDKMMCNNCLKFL